MDQGKILVAEDEESLRFVLKKALEEEGYWVQTAVDGSGAGAAIGRTRQRRRDGDAPTASG